MQSVVIVDPLPTTVAMCVPRRVPAANAGAFDESASPVPTGLAFNYATNVSYSTDGTTFGYTPVPDANGFDAAITAVRIAPTRLAAPTAAGSPTFRLRYDARPKWSRVAAVLRGPAILLRWRPTCKSPSFPSRRLARTAR